MKGFIYLFAFVIGILLPLQALINNQLRNNIGGSVMVSAFISFLTGALILFIAALILKEKFPTFNQFRSLKLWQLSGGLLGAIFVFGTIYLAPTIGTASMLSLIIAGQLLSSLIFDATGFLDVPLKEISLTRIIGATLVITGALLISFPNLLKR
jgi:transporter family-2 protein